MELENLYHEIINNLNDGVYFVDTERRITFWNSAAERITGYTSGEIIGRPCQDNILNHINNEGKELCLYGCPLHSTLIDGIVRNADVLLRHKDGHRIPVSVSIFPISSGGNVVGAVEIFTKSSPAVYEGHVIETLHNMAHNDQLTGLPNRRKLEIYLDYRLRELKHFGSGFCVVFLDLDDFSVLNNTYGHSAGDEMLSNIARSIRHSLRKSDMFGRWGGEEFVGIFESSSDPESENMAYRIRMLISNTVVKHGGASLSVTASVGVAIARPDDTIDSIIRRADTLMYTSKSRGKNCVTTDGNYAG